MIGPPADAGSFLFALRLPLAYTWEDIPPLREDCSPDCIHPTGVLSWSQLQCRCLAPGFSPWL